MQVLIKVDTKIQYDQDTVMSFVFAIIEGNRSRKEQRVD